MEETHSVDVNRRRKNNTGGTQTGFWSHDLLAKFPDELYIPSGSQSCRALTVL